MSDLALIHLAEECGELTQAAIKMVRFGADSSDARAKPPKSNRRALEEEAGDVIALISILVTQGRIDKRRLNARVKHKIDKLGNKYGI